MKNPVIWILRQIRGRIPAIALMTLAQVCQALFSVFFALGSRGVIDSAVAGDPGAFWNACGKQAAIIGVILVSTALMRHLHDRLGMDLERDWKRRLLHGLLHGEYSQVSTYHSAELLNRLNNDVNRVNSGILSILPNAAAMITRLVAAVVVLGVLDARFTVVIALGGSLVVLATGVSRLTESVYETRFFGYCSELENMGAKIKVEGKTANVTGMGERKLKGTTVHAKDLRAGAALIIAGLAAEGTTYVKNIHYVERGYERIIDKLTGLGAQIRRIED